MRVEQAVDLARYRHIVASGDARDIRRAAGLSLSEVAGAVGVTKAAVIRWERGESVPRERHAVAYGRLLEQLRPYRIGAAG